ncbi:MAG: histone deacetylase family protein [Pseudomonadota bacterium]
MTLIFQDPIFAKHETPPGHPECRERMDAVAKALSDPTVAHLSLRPCPPVDYESIHRAHPRKFVDTLRAIEPEDRLIALDPDTVMGANSWQAALKASGAACAAVDAIVAGEASTAFVASRPPGHHAERTRAMGFCLINHVAIAARHAQAIHGVERVAIIDFDVHHGNGTQDITEADPTIQYISTHQSPLFPGTGAASETGVGNIVNLPLRPGLSGTAYREIFAEHAVPALTAFAPDFVIISAGFDAHADDPLGGLALTEPDFAWITDEIRAVAERHAQGRVLSVLEGGYNLAALSRCVTAHVAALAA